MAKGSAFVAAAAIGLTSCGQGSTSDASSVAGSAACASGCVSGGASGSGASSSTGGSMTGTGGSAGRTSGSGGAPGGNGGSTTGSAGTTSSGGATSYPLDCGSSGVALEAHGPPDNRVNYVILGDCYSQADLDAGLMLAHVERMLDDPTRTYHNQPAPAGRFLDSQQPYLRYRNFVNICVLQTPSQDSGCGTATKNTAFDGYGNDTTRLGYVNNTKVNAAIRDLLPPNVMVDWRAVVLNDSSWWNSGGSLMVWSGGHPDAALAAQHEGGHAFFGLADEYGGTQTAPTSEPREINVTIDPTGAVKWNNWLGFDQSGGSPSPGTGVQGVFEGARYCDTGVWRPTDQSVMNSLWASSNYNSISLEKAVRTIYALVRPIDSSTPTSVTSPQLLSVSVVDSSVIHVDWSVDGAVRARDSGANFDVRTLGLSSGPHTIIARAYDDTPWVRGDRSSLEQSVTWTITAP